MERARVRTRQLPPLERSFERSRLEDDFIATAYEWVVPLRRRVLPTAKRASADVNNQPVIAQGGLSA